MNKGRKQGVFRPTSAEKTRGNIFSYDRPRMRLNVLQKR